MKDTVNVVVTGASGKMGRRIIRVAAETSGVCVAGASDQPGTDGVGKDAGTLAGLEPLGVVVADDLRKALEEAQGNKVVIDFTRPEACAAHAAACAEKGVPLVVGTTGLGEDAKAPIEQAAAKVPVIMAPNMSVGANLMILLARKAAESLAEEYDVEILEAHHGRKADAPSGTAMRLGEVVADALGRDLTRDAVYHREGMPGPRGREEIGTQTLRGGDVVGEHTVYFFGQGDRLELTHRAGSRDIFAHGAVRAARWLTGREAGLYGMEDVLRLA